MNLTAKSTEITKKESELMPLYVISVLFAVDAVFDFGFSALTP